MFEAILRQSPKDITCSTTFDQDRIDAANAAHGEMSDYLCPVCNNKGYVICMNDGHLTARECDCMTVRRTVRRICLSGLEPLLREYTFDSYKAETEKQKNIKRLAQEFVNAESGWFVICGRPGTGKTHICTAICSELIDGGKDVRYMLWREEAPRLKALVNDREQYDCEMDRLKYCDVLYIDDFWKGTVTDADINLTFELLNARYNDARKRTIISGEKSIEDILAIDEAIGSRIWQRSEGYRLRTEDVNRRLK